MRARAACHRVCSYHTRQLRGVALAPGLAELDGAHRTITPRPVSAVMISCRATRLRAGKLVTFEERCAALATLGHMKPEQLARAVWESVLVRT